VIFRRPFADLVRRQLDLFEQDNGRLIADCNAAEAAYDRADRDQAEERYGRYLDLVETGTELLAELRDAYAGSLDDDAASTYEAAFHSAVQKRFPRFALELPET
jgi:hypothetical protein